MRKDQIIADLLSNSENDVRSFYLANLPFFSINSWLSSSIISTGWTGAHYDRLPDKLSTNSNEPFCKTTEKHTLSKNIWNMSRFMVGGKIILMAKEIASKWLKVWSIVPQGIHMVVEKAYCCRHLKMLSKQKICLVRVVYFVKHLFHLRWTISADAYMYLVNKSVTATSMLSTCSYYLWSQPPIDFCSLSGSSTQPRWTRTTIYSLACLCQLHSEFRLKASGP